MDRAKAPNEGEKSDHSSQKGSQKEDNGDSGSARQPKKESLSSSHVHDSDNDLKKQEVNRRKRLLAASKAASVRNLHVTGESAGATGARIGLKTHSSSRRLGSFIPTTSDAHNSNHSNNQAAAVAAAAAAAAASPSSRGSDNATRINRRAMFRDQKGAHLSVPNLKHAQSLVEDERLSSSPASLERIRRKMVPLTQTRNSSFSTASPSSASSAMLDLDDSASITSNNSNPNPQAQNNSLNAYGRSSSTRRIMAQPPSPAQNPQLKSRVPHPMDKNAVPPPRRASFKKGEIPPEMMEVGNASIGNASISKFFSAQKAKNAGQGMDSSNKTGISSITASTVSASSVSARRAMFETTSSSNNSRPQPLVSSTSLSQQEARRLQSFVENQRQQQQQQQQPAVPRSGGVPLINKDGTPVRIAKMGQQLESRRLQQSSSQYTKRAPAAPLINKDGTPCRRHSFKEPSPSIASNNSKNIPNPDMDFSSKVNALGSSSYGNASARRGLSPQRSLPRSKSQSPPPMHRNQAAQLGTTTTNGGALKSPPSATLPTSSIQSEMDNSSGKYNRSAAAAAASPKHNNIDGSNDSKGSSRRHRNARDLSPPPDLKRLARDETIRLQALAAKQQGLEQQEMRHGGTHDQSGVARAQQDHNDSDNEQDGDDDDQSTSIFSQPGAFSVQGDSESITRLDRVQAKLFPAGPPPPVGSLAAAAAAAEARRRSTVRQNLNNSDHPHLSHDQVIAIAQAVVVPEYIDDDDESLMDDVSIRQNNRQRDLLEWTQKELDMQEREAQLAAREARIADREARLAERVAKLRAWEEELQRQQDLLQAQHPTEKFIPASDVVGISKSEFDDMAETPLPPPLRISTSQPIVAATSVVAIPKDDDEDDNDDDDDEAAKTPALKLANPLAASLSMFQRGGKMRRQQSLKQFLDENSSKSWRSAGKSLSRLRKGKKGNEKDTSSHSNETGSVGSRGVEDSDCESSDSSIATAPGPPPAEVLKVAALSAPTTPTSLLGDSLDNGTEHSRADDSGLLPGTSSLAAIGLPLAVTGRSKTAPTYGRSLTGGSVGDRPLSGAMTEGSSSSSRRGRGLPRQFSEKQKRPAPERGLPRQYSTNGLRGEGSARTTPERGLLRQHSGMGDGSFRFAPERGLSRTFSTTGLGDGPMRFAPSPYEPSLQAHLSTLDDKDRKVFRELKKKWDRRQTRVATKDPNEAIEDLPDHWHFRFLYFTAKQSKKGRDDYFSEDRAWSAEKKLKKRYVVLNVHSLRDQLQTKTLFPVPGLRSKDNHAIFYMRPSRYFPSKTPPKEVVDNLVYVLNTMTSHSLHAQREGLGVIACMDEFQMKNFEANYWYQLMMALQGYMVPVKVQIFLIVNPPSWFGAIWQIMKPMLVPAFRRRVKIVPESKMSKYLADDYQQYLPDEMKTGKASTDSMVEDYIAYRVSVEKDLLRRSLNEDDMDDALSMSMSRQRRFQKSSSRLLDYDDDDDDNSIASNLSGEFSLGSRGRYASRSRSGDGGEDDCDASILCDIGGDLMEDEDMKQPAAAAAPAPVRRHSGASAGRLSVASAHLSDMSLSSEGHANTNR